MRTSSKGTVMVRRGNSRVFRMTEKAGGIKYFRSCCGVCGKQMYWRAKQFLEKPFVCRHCIDKVADEDARKAEEDIAKKFPDYKRFKKELEKIAKEQPANLRIGGKNKTKNWMGVWPITRRMKNGELTTTAIHANCHSCGKQYSIGVGHFIKHPYVCRKCAEEYTGKELVARQEHIRGIVSDYGKRMQAGVAQAKRYASGEEVGMLSSQKLQIANRLQSVLPKHRVKCVNCGEERPCQGDWRQTSLVLCPGCYNEMGRGESSRIHEECRRRGISAVWNDGYGRDRDSASVAKIMEDVHKWVERRTVIVGVGDNGGDKGGLFDSDDAGGGNLQAVLERASIDGLRGLVKAGRVSKARARMEFARRKNVKYYASLPEVEEIPVLWK